MKALEAARWLMLLQVASQGRSTAALRWVLTENLERLDSLIRVSTPISNPIHRLACLPVIAIIRCQRGFSRLTHRTHTASLAMVIIVRPVVLMRFNILMPLVVPSLITGGVMITQ